MDVRPSPIAGRWYPAQSAALIRELDRYLDAAHPPALPGTIHGVVVPHAGLAYSGPVAAWAYAWLRGLRPEIIAVVGPMHQPAPVPVLTSAHAAYATPLGRVEVDARALHQLDQCLRAQTDLGLTYVREDTEHAIEIELPFLQRVLGSFRLLPLMLRIHQPNVVQTIGHALASVLRGRDALLVASSDLSHYQPQPVAARLDAELLRRIAAFDPDSVLSAEDEGVGYACGSAAIAAVLWTARDAGANQVTILRYGSSGDVARDVNWVVGYGAAAIWSTTPRAM